MNERPAGEAPVTARHPMEADEHPSVSVIIPARNEAQYIEEDIRAVLANDYPADRLEVVVVDGMSEDGTGAIADKIAKEDPRVRCVRNEARITPAAFNLGVRTSRGKVIFIVGGHAKVTPDFIRLSVKALREHPEAWCAGGCIETISTSYTGRCISAAMSSPIGVGNSMFRLGSYKGYVGTVAFGAYWRWVFDEIGYFDEELLRNQDDDFNQRLLIAGGKIYLDSDIKSSYYGRGSLRLLTRQYYQYGYWRIRTLQKHRRPLKFRQIVPLLFISALLTGMVSAVLWQPLRYYLAGLAALYGLVLIAGVADVTRRKGFRYAVLSPLIFIILHFGYGIGNLAGIWRFIVCDRDGIPRLAKTMPVAVAVAVALLAAVAGVDFSLDAKVSVNFLYFLPLALSVILLGGTAGIVCSVCIAAISLVDQLMTPGQFPIAVAIWNAFMRLGTLLAVCYLVDLWWQRRSHATRPGLSRPSWLRLSDWAVFAPVTAAGSQTRSRSVLRFLQSIALVYIPLAAIGCVDYLTGREIALSFFYILPVVTAVISQRLLGGVICAVLASAIFFALQPLDTHGLPVVVWNACMRLGVLLTVAFLTWRARNPREESATGGMNC